jgi:HlyD family secretion protein
MKTKMKLKKRIFFLIILAPLFAACSNGSDDFDAAGTFESEEIIVSSETAGRIIRLDVEEGTFLKENQIVGLIDTIQLHLKKKQLQAAIIAVLSKLPDVETQLAAIQEQIKSAEREKKRIESLVKENAATTKQLDDISSQVEVLKKQYEATKSSLTITKQGLLNEINPLRIQIEQTEDQINKSIIKNPVDGVVLSRYSKQNEITSAGKAIYRIADLSIMTLRAYVTGDQLPRVKIGRTVKVFVDIGDGEQKELSGDLYWISSKAEFTPKTIQTKDERASLVYAIKIRVKNEGCIKIGMYGEVKF